jgi:hypothetical protein
MTSATPNPPRFDKQDQFDKVATNLLQGEFVIAVYDGIGAGTGFIGLTNRRIVIQDNSFVGRKIALTSIPYSKINNVSFVSDKSVMGKFFSTSSISILSGGRDYAVDFRGEDKARHSHNIILWHLVGN